MQSVHLELPGVEFRPILHATHVVEPASSALVLRSQSTHATLYLVAPEGKKKETSKSGKHENKRKQKYFVGEFLKVKHPHDQSLFNSPPSTPAVPGGHLTQSRSLAAPCAAEYFPVMQLLQSSVANPVTLLHFPGAQFEQDDAWSFTTNLPASQSLQGMVL